MVPIIFTVLEKVQPCSRKINSAHKIKDGPSQVSAKERLCTISGSTAIQALQTERSVA
jgi:hypothetical protein